MSENRLCTISRDELKRRVKDLDKRMRDGEMGFQDLAIHLLNMEASRRKMTKYMKRKEQVDVLHRVRTMHPLVEGLDIPSPLLGNLPAHFKSMIDGRSIWRVEWMFNGRHTAMSTGEYENRYLGEAVKVRCTVAKIQDMVGFCKWDSAIKLWMESLYRPDQIVYYEGKAYLQHTGETKFQKVRMMSHVYDSDHVVSMTVVTDQAS